MSTESLRKLIGIVDRRLDEGLADEFMAMAREKGYNPRLRGTPDEERARTDAMLKQRAADRANAPAPAPVGAEERAGLESTLKALQAKFDPNYEYSDDHSFWTQQKDIAQQISNIKRRLAQGVAESVSEGQRSLKDYISEAARAYSQPVTGDFFAINMCEETLLETWVCDETSDGIVLHADDRAMQILEAYGYLGEELTESQDFEIDSNEDDVDVVDQGEYDQEGDMAKDDLETIVRAARRLTGMLDDDENMPEWVQSKINKAADYVDTAADYIESNKSQGVAEGMLDNPGEQDSPVAQSIIRRILMQRTDLLAKYGPERVGQAVDEVADFVGDVEEIGSSDVSGWIKHVERVLGNMSNEMDEAKYQGREVPLGKPMAGDVKKSKVYVRGPKGNVVKVNFGQKGMKIKKSIPGRRKNFRARHNCDNPGPRWKARYWSCRAW